MKNFFNKIPEEYKQKVALLITLIAALILIPLWMWNMDYASKSTTASNFDTKDNSSNYFGSIPNPLEKVDEQFKNQFNKPVQIKKTESAADEYHIYFEVENKSLANLVIPGQKIILRRADQPGPDYNPTQVFTQEGQQFAPIVPPGETRSGILVFPRVEGGFYRLIVNDLMYQEENQNEFDQVLDLEIEQEVWLPRT